MNVKMYKIIGGSDDGLLLHSVGELVNNLRNIDLENNKDLSADFLIREAEMHDWFEVVTVELEFHDGGDGVEYEVWINPETEELFRVGIEIVRDFDNIRSVFGAIKDEIDSQ